MKVYNANQNLKGSGQPINFTEEQIEEYVKCFDDPVYFIDNYCKIVTLDYGLQPFKLYDCQKKKIEIVHENRNVILMESRQSGKCLNSKAFFYIRNKKTGEIRKITVKEFHDMHRK